MFVDRNHIYANIPNCDSVGAYYAMISSNTLVPKAFISSEHRTSSLNIYFSVARLSASSPTMSPLCGFRNGKESTTVTDSPPRKVPKMDSFISGIIDYVARPSTTDSPVRVVHKKSESEAPCESIDSDGGMESFEVTEVSNLIDNDTESTAENDTWGQPSSLLSQFNVVQFNVPDVMRNNSVLTAEGIITCGDFACFNTMMDGDGDYNRAITAIPEEPTPSIETSVVKQFENAFAHFLYKNPAFSSMSYMTLQRLRSKLLKESAKNIKVEGELRKQLSALRESKQEREGELQRELLIVTKAKAAREAELQSYIQKTRHECAMIENMMLTDIATNNNNKSSNTSSQHVTPLTRGRTDLSITNASPRSVFRAEFLPHTHPLGHTHHSPGHSYSPGHSHSPGNNTLSMIAGSLSFEEFKREMYNNKMEQVHIRAEMELLKQKIAEQTVNDAFG